MPSSRVIALYTYDIIYIHKFYALEFVSLSIKLILLLFSTLNLTTFSEQKKYTFNTCVHAHNFLMNSLFAASLLLGISDTIKTRSMLCFICTG